MWPSPTVQFRGFKRGMDGARITQILTKNPLTRAHFGGVLGSNELHLRDQVPYFFIVNTQPQPMQGEHWTLIFVNSSQSAEFFDPLALPPNRYISRFLAHFRRVQMNATRLQSVHSQACGVFCLLYAIEKCKGASLTNICNRMLQLPASFFEQLL